MTQQLQETYIDLRPQIEPDEPKLSPLAFHVRRDAKIVASYEVRKYTIFAFKGALKGLRMAQDAIFYVFDRLAKDLAHDQLTKQSRQ